MTQMKQTRSPRETSEPRIWIKGDDCWTMTTFGGFGFTSAPWNEPRVALDVEELNRSAFAAAGMILTGQNAFGSRFPRIPSSDLAGGSVDHSVCSSKPVVES